MATRTWQDGTGASAQAQVDKFTPATVEVADIFTLTATAEDGSTTQAISFTATAATIKNVIDGMVALWNASANSLMTPITASNNADTDLRLTADTAGVPFSVASTTTEGGGNDTQTFTRAAITANKGIHCFDTAENWTGDTVPVDNDDILFADGSISLLYDLAQSAIEANSIKRGPSFTGDIGDSYRGYRLQIDAFGNTADTLVINAPNGGDTWIQGTFDYVLVSGGGGQQNLLQIAGGNATMTLDIGGSRTAGKVTGAASLSVQSVYLNSANVDLELGSGMGDLLVLGITAGRCTLDSPFKAAATSILNVSGGDFTITDGSNAAQTVEKINQNGGVIHWNANGVIGDVTVTNGLDLHNGLFDLRENPHAVLTIHDSRIWGGRIIDTGTSCVITYSDPYVKVFAGSAEVGGTVIPYGI